MGLFGFALILLLRKTVAPAANTGLLLSALCSGYAPLGIALFDQHHAPVDRRVAA